MNPSRLNTCRGAAELCGHDAIVNTDDRSVLLRLLVRAALTAREANELLFEDTSLGTATSAKGCWRAARRGAGGRVESLEPLGRLTRVSLTRGFFSCATEFWTGSGGCFCR